DGGRVSPGVRPRRATRQGGAWRAPAVRSSLRLELAAVDARRGRLAVGDAVDAVDPGAVGEREDDGPLERSRPRELLDLHLLYLPLGGRGRADLLELALRRAAGVATSDPDAAGDAVARPPAVALRVEHRIAASDRNRGADV